MNTKCQFLLYLKLCSSLLFVCESSTLQADIHMQENVDETLQDEFDDDWLVDEGRKFFSDELSPYHNEVGLKIPIFAFKLPGADETEATGVHANSLGVIGFAALFVIWAMGLAYYTSSQSEGEGEHGHGGGHGAGNGEENGHERFFSQPNYLDNKIIDKVYDSLFELPDVLNFESCAQLSVCEAYSQPNKYGMLSWVLQVLLPSQTNESDSMNLKKYKKAAIFGSKNLDCYEEFPCIIQPLDFVMYLKDYFTSTT